MKLTYIKFWETMKLTYIKFWEPMKLNYIKFWEPMKLTYIKFWEPMKLTYIKLLIFHTSLGTYSILLAWLITLRAGNNVHLLLHLLPSCRFEKVGFLGT